MLRKHISAGQKVFGLKFQERLFRKRTRIPSASRTRILRSMLLQLRDQELRRLKELVRNEARQKGSVPGDESDHARLHEDMELNVSLIDLTERRLSAILAALERLEEGRYGICGQWRRDPIRAAAGYAGGRLLCRLPGGFGGCRRRQRLRRMGYGEHLHDLRYCQLRGSA